MTGDIITGPTTIPCGGPFAYLAEMYSQMLRRQLDESDTSPLLQGWRADGLRDRLERFASDGIVGLVKANSLSRRTLVHGDFSESSLFSFCPPRFFEVALFRTARHCGPSLPVEERPRFDADSDQTRSIFCMMHPRTSLRHYSILISVTLPHRPKNISTRSAQSARC